MTDADLATLRSSEATARAVATAAARAHQLLAQAAAEYGPEDRGAQRVLQEPRSAAYVAAQRAYELTVYMALAHDLAAARLAVGELEAAGPLDAQQAGALARRRAELAVAEARHADATACAA